MTTRITKKKSKRRNGNLEPRKKPVQARSKESVRAILEATAQVFEQYGYAAGTTNRIAERAGVSIGTLYQYFPNKESLAVALLEDHLSKGQHLLNDWVGEVLASGMNLTQAITFFIEGMLDMHAGYPRLHHVLLEETPIPPRVHDTFLKIMGQAAKTVAGLLKGFSEVKRESLEDAAFLIVQTVEVLTHRHSTHPGLGLTRQKFSLELAAMITSYLKSSS